MPKDGVGGSAPVAAEPLALAEGQVIKDAGGKTIIEVELRQAPIEPRGPGQRIIKRAGVSTQAVSQTGIEISRIGIADQSVQPVPGALGFSLDLEGIVPGCPDAVIGIHTLKGRSVRPVVDPAAKSVSPIERIRDRHAAVICSRWEASAGRFDVFV